MANGDGPAGPISAVQGFVGSVVSTVTAPVDALNLAVAQATLEVLKFLPKMPAARLYSDFVFQFGHSHPHPPTFGVPIPSTGPVLASGCMSVLINGLPSARNGDLGLAVWCGGYFPIFEIITGSSHVFMGGARAARQVMDVTLHCLPDPLGGKWGIGKLDIAMAVFGVGMSALNTAAAMEGAIVAEEVASDSQGTADAEAAAAAAAAAGVGAGVAAAQLAADAAATAMGLLMGKDPGVGFPFGMITMGSPNVLVGGFPMPGWMTILKGLGKLLKPVIRKIQLKLPPGRIRNALCAVTGHPVEVVTGRMFTSQTDFEIEGRIPINFERLYDTSAVDYESTLGWGWTHPYDQHLWESKRYNCLVLRNEENRQVRFDKLKIGERYFQPLERIWLERKGETDYELFDCKTGLFYKFGQVFESDFTSEKTALRLTEIFNRNGNSLHLKYDGSLLTEINGGTGDFITFHYHDSAGRTRLFEIRHHLKNGQSINLMKFGYNGDSELISAANRTYVPYTYQYEDHLMTRETNRNGLSFHFEYDGEGQNARCVHTWGDGNIYERWLTYLPKAKMTKVKDGLGGETIYHYNELDLITKIFNADGGIIHYEYGNSGELLKRTDELGRSRTYEYDKQLNCISIQKEDGSAKNIVFDEFCQPLRIVDEAGAEWNREYDERGNLLISANPLGAKREYEYNRFGDVVKFRDPLGKELKFEWTEDGYVKTVERPKGSRTLFARNERNLLSEVVDEFTKTFMRYTYDDAGRITRISEINQRNETINVRKYQYDDQDNIVSYIDPLGFKTTYIYTGYDKLFQRINALGNKRQFKYDREERVIEIINERGNIFSYEYDLMDNVIEETSFDGAKKYYKHNPAGELIYQKDALDRETFYRRDELGRLISKLRSDATTINFKYDECGRMIGAQTGESEIKLSYDAAWNIIKEVQNGQTVENIHDLSGRRVTRKLNEKSEINYDYDEDGNLIAVKVGEKEIRYERDQAGRVLRRVFPNRLEESVTYNINGRLSSEKLSVGGGSRIAQRSYEWDARDTVIEIADSLAGTRSFKYDALERLQKVERIISGEDIRLPDVAQPKNSKDSIPADKRIWQADAHDAFGLGQRETEEFHYDANGNIVERNSNLRGSKKFSYGRGDKLEEKERAKYFYDAVGNLIEKRDEKGISSRFTYDTDNQLIAVSRDNFKVEFQYDAFGRRILKKTAEKATHFLWDGDVLLCENETEFIHQGFVPLAKIQQQRLEIYHTDHLGTPREVSDESGNIVWQGVYDEFGQVEKRIEKTEQNIRFQGQYEDEETGLYYNRFRYYDADGCRYINQDPIDLFGGVNFYIYAGNPLLWVDPLGLGKVDGGRHRHTKKEGRKHGTESHHIIADAISDLDYNDAPAIRMTVADHEETGSHGHQGNDGKDWRAKQKALVDAGKHDEALQMGIDDVKSKFPGKYDAEIEAMKKSLPKKDDGSIDWDQVKKKAC